MRELDYGKMGMRIRQVRKAKGWSQNELAEKCGISMSFLGHIERGSRIMSMETFANICTALDAPRRLGLHVTESSLLNPVKSVTAVVGLSDQPQKARIRGCTYCQMRESCALHKGGNHCEN